MILTVFSAGLLYTFSQPSMRETVLAAHDEVDPLPEVEVPIIPGHFFDQELFSSAMSQLKTESAADHIYGGVIPHHLVASPLIADFFQKIQTQEVTKIILIGPNHYERGDYPVLSAFADWETPFGVLKIDQAAYRQLGQLSFVGQNHKVLENEHSISGILPFIKYFLPDVKILPLIVKQHLSFEERKRLFEQLAPMIDDSTVIVASVDFSHYLSVPESFEKDEETIKAIESNNFEQILSMNSDYMDSPESIVILGQLMKTNEKTPKVLNHSNAGEITGNFSVPTTSYFELAFYE